MFGYSLTRPVHNQDYYYGIFDACEKFNCGIEGWHTESGPGVFEAALSFGEIQQMADKASLFKFVSLVKYPMVRLNILIDMLLNQLQLNMVSHPALWQNRDTAFQETVGTCISR
jgi:hypothetical protein